MNESLEVLRIEKLCKDFSGLEILSGVDLIVKRGERHAVIGPNGAGKTTLFNIITGKYKPSSGRIYYRGRDVSGLSPDVLAQMGIARSFQITNVFQGLTVLENVLAGVRSKRGLKYSFFRRPVEQRELVERAKQIIEAVGLYDLMDRPVTSLAYGQQRALEIAITLSLDPHLILLDEPTAGMTREETKNVIELIDRITRGRTLIIIEHDMDVVFSLADTISVLHHGVIIASGSPEKIRNDQRVKDAYLGEE
ncbi:ABC transporter ATP-binding protein [Thermodesulforhabdus norvegica]|uniref:Amino acid/amide ABC transporter ATP-binding protein 1, HAAT family (TC 3.A.1.4.-) n=1 Tax=Thermodesulforhabdus norvegica TaxID=39841 RepID=A0A1I4W3W9_9BACT|nr:ABC transporter ATP-binding protein [Thermodesulforhabdus norvegica]SFN07960.1 amino acid/amide ABC transporter ATP-binding protein 1, HAAT family (TC 3.A.1.4.-) [Thermodesulforhabdus norvegica]